MSQAFCLLSRSEGFCNALLEAMACGVPSVVARVGGNPEAIREGENGFLVASEDDEAAAERLLFLLRNPARAVEIGEAGRVEGIYPLQRCNHDPAVDGGLHGNDGQEKAALKRLERLF